MISVISVIPVRRSEEIQVSFVDLLKSQQQQLVSSNTDKRDHRDHKGSQGITSITGPHYYFWRPSGQIGVAFEMLPESLCTVFFSENTIGKHMYVALEKDPGDPGKA